MERLLSGQLLPADAVIVALFLIFAVAKGSRGLYDSLLPLVITLVSIAGAAVLAWALTDAAAARVFPLAREELGSRMDLGAIRNVSLTGITSQLERLMPDMMMNLLRKLRLELPPFVDEAFQAAAPGAAAREIAEDAVSAMLLPVTRAVVRALLFFAAFLALKLLLSLIGRALGLAFDLPVIRVADRLGGALIGVIWCAAVVYILCWLLDLFAPPVFERLTAGSRILSYMFKAG